MAYDDPKLYEGRRYSGMQVGGSHDWDYTDGRWQETKATPDMWDFSFRSTKRRRSRAPPGSGAEKGAMFHWLVLAHQRVRKLDEDTYETFMEGAKWKVAHRKPGWKRWSTEYPQRETARDRTAAILEATARALRAGGDLRAARLEPTLEPAVLRDGVRSLDDFAVEEE